MLSIILLISLRFAPIDHGNKILINEDYNLVKALMFLVEHFFGFQVAYSNVMREDLQVNGKFALSVQ